MTNVVDFLQANAPFLIEHKYLLLLIATSLEGFNTIILAGFLVSIGALGLVPTVIIVLCGEIINSYMWYAVGYWGGAKPIDWFIKNSPKKKKFVEGVREYLHEHTGKFMLLMKLTYSVTSLGLILIGSTKFSIKKFSWYNVVGSIGWVIMTLSIGYFFGQGFKLYAHYFKELSLAIVFIVSAIIVVVLLEHFSSGTVNRTISFNQRLNELNKKINSGISNLLEPPEEKG